MMIQLMNGSIHPFWVAKGRPYVFVGGLWPIALTLSGLSLFWVSEFGHKTGNHCPTHSHAHNHTHLVIINGIHSEELMTKGRKRATIIISKWLTRERE